MKSRLRADLKAWLAMLEILRPLPEQSRQKIIKAAMMLLPEPPLAPSDAEKQQDAKANDEKPD